MKIKHILQGLILFCCVLVYLNGAYLLAQEKQIQYKLKVEVKLLYVLALDKEGNPVTDLQKEDFTLFVDGQPQEIESFSLVTHTAEGAEAEQEEFAAERLDIQDISPEEPKVNKRFILAALPYSYESLAHLHRAKRAIIHLIEHARYPEDWIAIVVIHGDWISTIQDFTCSKEKLLQKIDAYFNLDRKKIARLESQYHVTAEEIYQAPQLPIFQGEIPVSGGMDIIPALELIAERMRVLEGRKIILCFGLPVGFLGANSIRLWAALEMVNKMLSRNITIYYIELERPDAYSGSGNIFELAALESSHFALANETGGKYYHNVINPTYCVDDVDKINSSYYLMSFTITEELRKKKSLTIQIECKRKGVRLRYSNKHYAPDELEEKRFEETYKKVSLYKCLLSDVSQPALKIYGQ
ncbi:MAG: VWA domain-containing protein, partial [Elusimicrobiota bacterium]|nr:VWA domain-containing protein [Elusimicrobiota bacterium]